MYAKFVSDSRVSGQARTKYCFSRTNQQMGTIFLFTSLGVSDPLRQSVPCRPSGERDSVTVP